MEQHAPLFSSSGNFQSSLININQNKSETTLQFLLQSISISFKYRYVFTRESWGAVANDFTYLPVAVTFLSQSLAVVNTGRPLKMAAELHPRSGKLIGLSNSNRTARRNQPVQEFNHGLVLSKEPLRDRDVFTVRIDKKVNKQRALLAPPRRQDGSGAAGTSRGSVAVRELRLPLLLGRHSRCDSRRSFYTSSRFN